jgi:hypothetical protein
MVIGRALPLAPRPSGIGQGEPGAAAAVDGDETHNQAPAPPERRPTVWIALARFWRNWRMAVVLVQPDTVVRWHRDWLRRRWTRLSKPQRDGRPPIDRQIRAVPAMATANPLREAPWIHGELSNTRCRCFRTHGVASAGTARASALPDVETFLTNHLFGRVEQFLHRSDAHRPSPVLPGPPVTSPSPQRACQHHGSSDGHLAHSASGRGISARHGAPKGAPRSRHGGHCSGERPAQAPKRSLKAVAASRSRMSSFARPRRTMASRISCRL